MAARQTVEEIVRVARANVTERSFASPAVVENLRRALAEWDAQLLLVLEAQFLFDDRETILDQIRQMRLPTVYGQRGWVTAGGLMSYAASRSETSRQLARSVDRILHGTKPSDLPVEQPTAFDLIINLKAAQALGLTIPPSVLAQATEIIQ